MSNAPEVKKPADLPLVQLDREDMLALLQTVAGCSNCESCKTMIRDALLLAGLEVKSRKVQKAGTSTVG